MRFAGVAAISLDLDDTLWPFQPAVERAEATLHAWLVKHAPGTARILPARGMLGKLRNDYEHSRPDLAGNYRALRIGSIELALALAGEDMGLAEEAYGVFYSARQKVEFFEDVWPALTWLSARFPLVALTNGNADLRLTGGGAFFRETLSARAVGIAKPQAGIFHAAALAAGVPASELLHVGDDFHLDYLGALNAGLQAAWLVRDHPKETAPGEYARYVTIRDLTALCCALGGPANL
ncbi:HAD family hydrolase [Cupriavidus sp. USMAA2-4]|uniref:HAD family hydrolase n=1 Tax=Cupriavidus malaysiensis TaxID=367825 RepID=A0ABN4TE04_9BURK|nr:MULTISPECIES: HAD-IA family hydrolase [Cupriavidus]AOY91955.1 HAD family hydrolase [Cupriavidus sp. USMAA2-4]AOZ04916.1 HAD family hydrolase [Cupriavidus malaysiensis]